MPIRYDRVLPRDLFNEAKLLKCVGQLVLCIEDAITPPGLTFEHDEEPFQIYLLEDGHLFIQNIWFFINDQPLFFKTIYNSRRAFPLLLEYEGVEYFVFDDNGSFTEECLEVLNQLLQQKAA